MTLYKLGVKSERKIPFGNHKRCQNITIYLVKVNFNLEQTMKAHRGSRGIALPFHDHGTRRG